MEGRHPLAPSHFCLASFCDEVSLPKDLEEKLENMLKPCRFGRLVCPKKNSRIINNRLYDNGWKLNVKVEQKDEKVIFYLNDRGVQAFERGEIVTDSGGVVFEECESPIVVPLENTPNQQTKFSYMELFAGIGGFRVALDRLGGQCLFASEIDAEAIMTYRANFKKDSVVVGDLDTLQLENVPFGSTLLVGGFPCQPFTCAGEGKGFSCEKNGSLFFQIVKLLKLKQPLSFMLENVPNLLNTEFEGMNTKDIIVSQLQRCGYDVTYAVIDCGLLTAQARFRLFFVGFRKDKKVQFEWPKIPDLNLTFAHIEEQGKDDEYFYLTEEREKVMRKIPVIERDGKCRTIMASYLRSHRFCGQFVRENGKHRFMTKREVARAQGFPDSFILDKCNNKNRIFAQLGNAVNPPIICAIACNVLKSLNIPCDEQTPTQMAKETTTK